MKKNYLFGMTILIAALLGACKTQQQVQPAQPTEQRSSIGVEIELPCVESSWDDDEYFRALGTASHVNQQSARTAAFDAAQSMLQKRLGGFVQGLSSDYSRTVAGQAEMEKVQRMMEGEMNKIVEKMLNDAQKTCEKMYQNERALFTSYIAIQIPKKVMIDNMMNTLSNDEELEIEFNREQFRKYAEEKMAKMKEAQKAKNN